MAMLLGGCANADGFRLFGFDAGSETDSMRSAGSEWCDRTVGDWCPTIDADSDDYIVIQDNVDECGVPTEGTTNTGCAKYVGATYSTRAHFKIIILDRRENPNWTALLRQLLMHELGHVGGCSPGPTKHLPVGNVMAASAPDEPEHLTVADVACVMD